MIVRLYYRENSRNNPKYKLFIMLHYHYHYHYYYYPLISPWVLLSSEVFRRLTETGGEY